MKLWFTVACCLSGVFAFTACETGGTTRGAVLDGGTNDVMRSVDATRVIIVPDARGFIPSMLNDNDRAERPESCSANAFVVVDVVPGAAPPRGVDACTKAQVAEFLSACATGDANGTRCRAFRTNPANASCARCAAEPPSGVFPFINQSKSNFAVDDRACVDSATPGCGSALGQLASCVRSNCLECASNEDVQACRMSCEPEQTQFYSNCSAPEVRQCTDESYLGSVERAMHYFCTTTQLPLGPPASNRPGCGAPRAPREPATVEHRDPQSVCTQSVVAQFNVACRNGPMAPACAQWRQSNPSCSACMLDGTNPLVRWAVGADVPQTTPEACAPFVASTACANALVAESECLTDACELCWDRLAQSACRQTATLCTREREAAARVCSTDERIAYEERCVSEEVRIQSACGA